MNKFFLMMLVGQLGYAAAPWKRQVLERTACREIEVLLMRAEHTFSDSRVEELSETQMLNRLRQNWPIPLKFFRTVEKKFRATAFQETAGMNELEKTAVRQMFHDLQSKDFTELEGQGFFDDGERYREVNLSNARARLRARVFGPVSAAERLALIKKSVPEIENVTDLVKYLDEHGRTAKVLAEVSGISLSGVYKYIRNGEFPDFFLLYLDDMFWELRDPNHPENQRAALAAQEQSLARDAFVARAREELPELTDQMIIPESVVDVMSPFTTRNYLTAGTSPWIHDGTKMSAADLEITLRALKELPAEEQAALRWNYNRRKKSMVGRTDYDPDLSLQQNMVKLGHRELQKINPNKPPAQLARALLERIVSQAQKELDSKTTTLLRRTELTDAFGVRKSRAGEWLNGAEIPEYVYLPLVEIYRALKNQDAARLSAVLGVSETRAQEILKSAPWKRKLNSKENS